MGRSSRLKKERQLRVGELPPHLRKQIEEGRIQRRRGDPPRQKISAALIELMRPLVEGNEPIEVYRSVVGLAAAAWNLSNLEPEAAEVDIARYCVAIGKDRADMMERCLRDLMERKHRLFPHDHRIVAHWEVEDQGHQYYLRAASLS